MNSRTDKLGQLICGAGGIGLIVSLFIPWTGSGEAAMSGWELWSTFDVLLLIVGIVAGAMAVTGGRFGLFRPDLSLRGAADLLGVIASAMLVWLVLFDFPPSSGPEIGAYVALLSAIAVMGGAGDYATLRGAPAFPPTTKGAP